MAQTSVTRITSGNVAPYQVEVQTPELDLKGIGERRGLDHAFRLDIPFREIED
jgi:hypothetical protein